MVVIQTIIQLAHALKLRVVAEGIETEISLEMLASRGCDAAQGFYIAKPSDAKSMDEWLKNNMP